jgi:hypothetical protein
VAKKSSKRAKTTKKIKQFQQTTTKRTNFAQIKQFYKFQNKNCNTTYKNKQSSFKKHQNKSYNINIYKISLEKHKIIPLIIKFPLKKTQSKALNLEKLIKK